MSQARSACSSSRDEDDSAGLSIPDSGSKTWGTPQGKFGQGHVNWSGLSNLFKDEDEDAFSGMRMCCQAMMPSCLACHARNRQIAKFRKAQFDEDDDALGGFSDPPHLGAQRPTGESIGNWLNLRL
jgi:hypothetical protein